MRVIVSSGLSRTWLGWEAKLEMEIGEHNYVYKYLGRAGVGAEEYIAKRRLMYPVGVDRAFEQLISE